MSGEQHSPEQKLHGVKYEIQRDVTQEGEPRYVLYRTVWSILGSDTRKIAENRDRRVLEQAITFLEVGE